MENTVDQPLELKHYFRMFWRRKALILLCSVTVLCATLMALEFVPPGYQSSAVIRVEERQRLSDELEKLVGTMRARPSGYRVDEERLAAVEGRVRSLTFLEKVVRLLRMNEDPLILQRADRSIAGGNLGTRDEVATRLAVNELRRKVSVEPAASSVYHIIITDTNPQSAHLLARWVSELFVDVSAQQSLEELRRAHDFGAEQLKIYEEQLRRSELALEQYRETQIEQSLSRRVVSERNVTVAETLHKRISDEADLTRFRVTPFERTLSAAGMTRMGEQVLTDAEIRNDGLGLAAALEDALTERLLSDRNVVGEWPPSGEYVTLRRTLFQNIERHVQTNYADQPADVRDALARYVFSTLDHRAHSSAADYLGSTIDAFRLQATSGPRGELELDRLESEVESNREMLSLFRAQLIAADVTQAVETTNLGPRIEILDPPQVPGGPSSPNRVLILAAAIGLGPLLGLGMAMVVELLDSTLHGIGDFQRIFDGPILGTTPLVTKMTEAHGTFRRYWVHASLICVLLGTLMFFVAQATVWPTLGADDMSMRAIDPQEAVAP